MSKELNLEEFIRAAGVTSQLALRLAHLVKGRGGKMDDLRKLLDEHNHAALGEAVATLLVAKGTFAVVDTSEVTFKVNPSTFNFQRYFSRNEIDFLKSIIPEREGSPASYPGPVSVKIHPFGPYVACDQKGLIAFIKHDCLKGQLQFVDFHDYISFFQRYPQIATQLQLTWIHEHAEIITDSEPRKGFRTRLGAHSYSYPRGQTRNCLVYAN